MTGIIRVCPPMQMDIHFTSVMITMFQFIRRVYYTTKIW